MLQMNFIVIPYFDWLLGPLKGQIFEKKIIFKNLFLRNCLLYETENFASMSLALASTKIFFPVIIRTLVAMATVAIYIQR